MRKIIVMKELPSQGFRKTLIIQIIYKKLML